MYLQLIKNTMSARSNPKSAKKERLLPKLASTVDQVKSAKPGSSKSRPSSRAKSAKSTTSSGSRSGGESARTMRSGSAASRRVTIKSADLNERGLRVLDMAGQGMANMQSSLFSSE